MKKLILPLFFLLVIIQWAVPAGMIWKKEAIQRKGTDYKFRTEPVDPYDPFIGKYIVLRYKQPQVNILTKELKNTDREVYVTFKKDKQGFAQPDKITDKIPEGSDYLKTSITNMEEIKDSTMIMISYPFTRFYMEESKAPEAEQVYGVMSRDSASKVYALVSIYNGDAAIKNVFVNDTAITEMVKKRQQLK